MTSSSVLDHQTHSNLSRNFLRLYKLEHGSTFCNDSIDFLDHLQVPRKLHRVKLALGQSLLSKVNLDGAARTKVCTISFERPEASP